jgi:hypothetical protein
MRTPPEFRKEEESGQKMPSKLVQTLPEHLPMNNAMGVSGRTWIKTSRMKM